MRRMAGNGATLPSVHDRSKDGSLRPLRPLAVPIPKVCGRAEPAARSTTAWLRCYVQLALRRPMIHRRLSF